MTVANRTMERGELLARQLKANVMRLAELPDRLHEFDAVISCTASTLPLIGLGAVERALKKRKNRPMFMVDLAVPRDIEPEVKALEDVYLYTVDDLASVMQTGQAQPTSGRGAGRGDHGRGGAEFSALGGPTRLGPADSATCNAQADTWREAEVQPRTQTTGQRRKPRKSAGSPVTRIDAKNAARRHGRVARQRHGGERFASSRQATPVG